MHILEDSGRNIILRVLSDISNKVFSVFDNPGKSLDLKNNSRLGKSSKIYKVLEVPGIFFCLSWR